MDSESRYSEEITRNSEVFRSTILQPFQFELERKETCGKESNEKEINIFTLQIYYIMYYNRKSPLVQMRTLLKRSERNRLSLL